MVRLFKVKDLTQRKRVLVAQSNIDRQALKLQLATAVVSFEHIKSRLAPFEMSSFAFKTFADIAGLFVSRGVKPTASGGIISRVISGIKFFNIVKDFFRGMKSAAPAPTDGSAE
jgi:hypothetical protein